MTLFIGNLSYDVREREIEDFFAYYGRIARIDMKRGYCFLEFEDKRDAEDALREDGVTFSGSKISVEWAKSERRHAANPDECFRCGRTGHWARDCPEDGGSGRRSGRGGGGRGGGGGGRYRSRSRERKRNSRSRSRSDSRRRRSPSRSRSREGRRDRSRS